MVDLLILSALLGIPTAYIVRLLWLDTVEVGFEGFFVHQRKFVVIQTGYEEMPHTQRRAWTDYIRQLLFNVYDVSNEVTWELKPNRQGLVRCTFCLSFWVGIAPAIALVVFTQLPIWAFFIVHLTIASVAALLSDRM